MEPLIQIEGVAVPFNRANVDLVHRPDAWLEVAWVNVR